MTDFEKLDALRAEASLLTELHPEVKEVTVIQTARENIHYVLGSTVQPSATDHLMDALRDSLDTHVLWIVFWVYGRVGWEVDLPSISLRTRLVELDIRNRDALMLLYGERGRHARPLHTTLPPSMQKDNPL